MLPNTGCDEVAAAAEVKENMELEEAPVDDPKIVGALLGAVIEADDPKENPDEEDGLNVEPNRGALGACQLEPKVPEAMPLLELRELASEEEELIPNVAPEPKGLASDTDDPNTELPEEIVVFPASPNDGDDADEAN